MSELDKLLYGEATPAPTPVESTDKLSSSLFEASLTNPDEEVKKSKFSELLDIPSTILPPNASQLADVKENDAAKIKTQSPKTATFLENEAHAKVTGLKDVKSLEEIEKAHKSYTPEAITGYINDYTSLGLKTPAEAAVKLGELRKQGVDLSTIPRSKPLYSNVGDIITDPLKSMAAGVNLVGADMEEMSRYLPQQRILNSAVKAFTGKDLVGDTQAQLNQNFEYWQGQQSEAMQSMKSEFQKAGLLDSTKMLVINPALLVDQLAQSLPYLAPNTLAAQGGKGVMTGYLAISEAMNAANTARQEAIAAGATPEQQDAAAASAAIVTAPLAFLGNKLAGTGALEADFLTNGTTGHSLLSTMLREFFAGAIEEGANTGGVNVGAKTTYDPTRELFANVGKSMVIGGILESTHGAGMNVLGKFLSDTNRVVGANTTRTSDAAQAEAAHGTLETLGAQAAENKLRERSPEAFHTFVETMSEDSELQEVYVNAETMQNTLLQNPTDWSKTAPELASAIAEAVGTGGDVRISVPDYLTYIAGTPMEAAILPELRATPNGSTFKEAQEFYQQQKDMFTEDVEKVIAQNEPVMSKDEFYKQQEAGAEVPETYEQYLTEHKNIREAYEKDVEAVEDILMEQFAKAKRFTTPVNREYIKPIVEFYKKHAPLYGVSPSQLYTQYPFKVQSFLNLPAGAELNQAIDSPLLGIPASAVGPSTEVRSAAEQYMAQAGLPYTPAANYVTADPERGARIAAEYEAMPDSPNDPEVKAAYAAMIAETLAQYQVLKGLGYTFDFIADGAPNPYEAGPRMALEDMRDNKHLWVYPTDSGFGQGEDNSANLLLTPTDEYLNGKQMLANDVFRLVHDVFGHGKEGVGFGPNGEENAWQSHVRMYSPLAARAMTTETRGQNSWVNFGPHGEANRANQKETVYAAQKVGLLPEWVMTEGRENADAPPIDIAKIGSLQQKEIKLTYNPNLRRGEILPATPEELAIREQATASSLLEGVEWTKAMAISMERAEGELMPSMKAMLAELPPEATKSILRQLVNAGREAGGLYNEDTAPEWAEYRKARARTWVLEQKATAMFYERIGAPEYEGMLQDRTQTENPTFKAWFDGSKVVSESGKPLISFHGTGADITRFNTLINETKVLKNPNWTGQLGSWFATPSDGNEYETGNAEATAEVFANDTGIIYPVYLSIKNPMEYEGYEDLQDAIEDIGPITLKAQLKAEGYDGIVVRGSDTDGGQIRDDWVAFEPTQVKSAIGNKGTFDPKNPDILYQGGKVGEVTVRGVHYSKEQRETISGTNYGTGARGAEAKRINAADDERIKTRVYFYVDEGKGITPEYGVGNIPHLATLNNMYDGARNPLNFPALDFNEFEKAVLNAGFDGYYIEAGFGRQGAAVVLGDAAKEVKPDPRELAQSATVRRGTENLKRFGLDPDKVYTVREVAAALEARQRKKYGMIDDKDISPEASKRIAAWMAEEVMFELEDTNKSAVGWYSTKFQEALDLMAQDGAPELLVDPNARGLLTAIIAITSDGQKIMGNLAQAMEVYKGFFNTDTLEPSRHHNRQASVDANLEALQELFDALGPSEVHEFLLQEKTVKELRQIAKDRGLERNVNYAPDIKLPMAALIFSPKLGAFYANLMGKEGYLTMDRWWVRTFNRYRGTLLTQATQGSLDKFRELLGKPELSDDETISVASTYEEAYRNTGYKAKTELNKLGNTIHRAAFGVKQSPARVSDRTFMIETTHRAKAVLAKKGVDISIADIQAALWYYEKRLYGQLGARDSADISYADAARGLLALNGDYSSVSQGDVETVGDRLSAGAELYQSTPFFSGLTRAVEGVSQNKASATQWKGLIKNLAGVKAEEVEWTGLNDWLGLQEGQVTKEQVLEYLNTNGVKVDEVINEAYTPTEDEIERVLNDEAYEGASREEAIAALVDDRGATNTMRYSEYTVAGGENYKELLLTLPLKDVEKRTQELNAYKAELTEKYGTTNWTPEMTAAEELRFTDLVADVQESRKAYKPSHFDTPNILAHIRFDERTDADGNKVLFINEIQSDWAQEGKKKGFKHKTLKEFYDSTRLPTDATFEELEARGDLGMVENIYANQSRVPTAPFVGKTDAWVALALKRMVRYAAENGFDKVAFINGEQAADLYDLSKHLTAVRVRKDGSDLYTVMAEPMGGSSPISMGQLTSSELPEKVGKDLAEKIVGQTENYREYRDIDLKVGGEGMRTFYDTIVPKVAKGVLKKVGGQLRVENLSDGNSSIVEMVQNTIVIAPDMKVKILQGLPLFQGQRGSFNTETLTTTLLQGADFSTVIHESGHFYLKMLENLAARPDAPAEIREDFEKAMTWFGVDPTAWGTMTLDEQRPYHEQWAQSFERWNLEGVAPTQALQPTLSRFRAWLLSVYKSLEDFLLQNPEAGKLNDEVRQIFGRLIASQEAIEATEAARAYQPLFNSAEEAGVSQTAFDNYVNLGKSATQQAVDELQARSLRDMKWLTNARNAALKALQNTAKGIREKIEAEVMDEVRAEPIELARTFLRTGETTAPNGDAIKVTKGYKLNTKAIAEMYPQNMLSRPDLTALRGMTSPEGLDPDIVAQMFGLPSGDALVRELAAGESTASKVEGMTDQRMLQEHGDLIDERSIQRAADEAVHNEARARFMATGLKMLTHSPVSVSQMTKAAKQAADNAISGKKVRDLRPKQYEAAETRANKEALKLLPKDPEAATRAQRTALLNNKLAASAQEAVNEVEKALKYLAKFNKEGTRKNLDLEYLEQIDALLESFDLRKGASLSTIDARTTLGEWIAQQEAQGFEPTIDAEEVARIKQKSYKNMTMDEMRGLVDTVKQIEHMGRMIKKLLTAQERADFNERIAEAKASIALNANRVVKEKGTPSDVVGQLGQWVRQMLAAHRKFASFMRELDGGQNNGALFNLLVMPMGAAGNAETAMKADAAEALSKLFEPIMAEIATLGNIYARKRVVAGTNISMTHEQRIMFAMYWGNEGNRQRLLDGGITGKKAMSAQEARAVLDTLTKSELDFVQGVWDYIATFKPAIEAQERELTGKTPEWVEPAEVQTKYGVYAGGYFPAIYDGVLSTRSASLDAASDLRLAMKGAFGSAATKNGHTKARAQKVVGRPLLLNFNAVSRHVNQVVHRLAWQNWITDANRIIRALDADFRTYLGAEALTEIRKLTEDVAVGDVGATTPVEVAINRIRTGTSIVGMGWKLMTAMAQPFGISNSFARVGSRHIARGLQQFLTNPIIASQWVNDNSVTMANRHRTQNREMNEILNTVRAGKKATALASSYFYLISKFQRMVDVPTYLGAYERALEEQQYESATSDEERKAIEHKSHAIAAQTVIDTQGGGELKDLARAQRGGPLQKLFTNFYSYMSTVYNMNAEAYRLTDFKNPTEIGVFAVDMLLINIVPVILVTALKNAAKGTCEWDDTECLINRYKSEQISHFFGQLLLVRELGTTADALSGGQTYGYTGPSGLQFFANAYKTGVQAGQGEVDEAFLKAANNTAGALFHYPAGAINNFIDGAVAIENGEVEGLAMFGALAAGAP